MAGPFGAGGATGATVPVEAAGVEIGAGVSGAAVAGIEGRTVRDAGAAVECPASTCGETTTGIDGVGGVPVVRVDSGIPGSATAVPVSDSPVEPESSPEVADDFFVVRRRVGEALSLETSGCSARSTAVPAPPESANHSRIEASNPAGTTEAWPLTTSAGTSSAMHFSMIAFEVTPSSRAMSLMRFCFAKYELRIRYGAAGTSAPHHPCCPQYPGSPGVRLRSIRPGADGVGKRPGVRFRTRRENPISSMRAGPPARKDHQGCPRPGHRRRR